MPAETLDQLREVLRRAEEAYDLACVNVERAETRRRCAQAELGDAWRAVRAAEGRS